jgi:hypothetical protein
VSFRRRVVTIYLAPMLPSGSSDQPGELAGRPYSLYSVLLRMGFAQPAIRIEAGELLPRHFTLTLRRRAVCFCGTFHRVAPPGYYPASCPAELGLSSPPEGGAVTRFTWPSNSVVEGEGRVNGDCLVPYSLNHLPPRFAHGEYKKY